VDERLHFRNLWVSIGAAMLIGGYVASTDWLFIVRSAPSTRHLSSFSLPLLAPGMFFLIGLYVILAGLLGTKWLWLPGKSRVRIHEDQRKRAEFFTSLFHSIAVQMSVKANPTSEDVSAFILPFSHFIISAWGLHEFGPFMATEDRTDNKKSCGT